MASSSSSHQQNEEHHAFSWIEPPGKRRKVSESSRLFDVFINHRGPDVKQTLARQLYNSLQELGLRAYLDSEEKELGYSFLSTIETAIRSASVHIAIFSESYAESAWCLEELVLMSESKAKIIPVFYGVQPWELRHTEKGVYAKAFTDYEEKGRYLDRLEKWKEALHSASLITGAFQFNNLECASSASGFELKNSEEYENIVLAVQKEVPRTKPLVVAEHPVGLHKLVKDFERRCLQELVRDFDSQCGINEGCTKKVKIVGIFGMGGVGKTTLSKELFNQKSSQYSRACFLFDVREASARREIPSLQKKLLKDIFHEIPNDFLSAEEGRSYLRDRLRRGRFLSFLIVLDDIDHVKQLDDLLVRDLLNNSGNSLVIVTTRDEGVLISAGITIRYNLKALNKDDGKELFCWHSCGQPHAPPGYEALVDAFVDRCQGLPLSFQVLGRHVYGRTNFFWCLELRKLHSTLPGDIRDTLKISFDGLDSQEKQIFLDIACFFVDRSKSIALRVWEGSGSGSGWSAQHALEALKSKCLVEEIRISSLSLDGLESEDRIELRMHDHLRDLGREITNEPGHPHRLWRHQNDESLEFQSILAQTKGRCFHSIVDNTMNCRITFFIGESDNRYELSTSLLWLQLEYLNSRVHPSIPSWIPLQNLQCLRISGGHLKRLWPRNVQAPSQLKELHIYQTFVEKFPDLLGISNKLEKVVLDTEHMPIKGFSLSGSMRMNLRTFNSDIEGKTWKSLSVQEFKSEGNMAVYMDFNNGGETENIKAPVSRRENLEFTGEKLITKLLISGNNCPSLESLQVHDMGNLIEVDLTSLKTLSCVEVTDCKKFKRLSATSDHTNLVVFNISQCPEFKELCFGRESCVEKIAIKNCLKRVGEISDLGKLVELTISECRRLQELRFVHLNSMERITIENCTQLKSVSGISDVKKLVEFNLHECPQLQEFSFSYLSCLEIIKIYKCSSLKSVSGIFDLAKLVEFNMSECCELQEISFGGQNCLERVTIQCCKKLKRVSGISDLAKLIEFNMNECCELQELSFGGLNCLERVTIQYCKKLKTVSGMLDLGKLVILNICDCPELEGMPALLGPSCPERIIINECGKLNCLDLGTCQNLKSVPLSSDQMTLAELKISEYPLPVKISEYPLQELSLAQMSNQEKIIIENCNNLKSVSGISDLRKLVDLSISQCGELFELCVSGLDCLERITVDICGNLKYFELDGCKNLKTVSGMRGLEELAILKICDCPEFEDLPSLVSLTCLKMITIDGCGKLNCLDLCWCRNLKTVSGDFDLAELIIEDCPELEDLPCFASLTCLEKISIVSCGKLQNITFPATLKSLDMGKYGELKSVSGISDLRKLVDLSISQCGELFELCVSGLDCLERITVDSCGNLKYFELDGCKNLKTVSGMEDLEELAILKICNCPEFEDLPLLRNLNCLKTIRIDGCGKLNCLGLWWCQNLKTVSGGFDLAELIIWDCPELEDLPCFASLTCLEKISIVNCGKLQNITFPATLKSLNMGKCGELYSVSGISDLTKLFNLNIYECPKLEFELRLGDMNCLKSIEVDRCGKLKCLELNGCKILKRVSGMKGLEELALLKICDCPELENVSEIFEASCLEIITIDRCEKLNYLRLRSCKILKRVSGNLDLKALDVWECPELELSSSLARLSCLESLQIGKCEKLQSIAGVEEMNALKDMRLAYCSNAVLRNCIHRLQSVPSEGMVVIGRAADGAESTLNPQLFSEAVDADAVIQFDNPRLKGGPLQMMADELSAVIVCAVVVVDSSIDLYYLNRHMGLPSYLYSPLTYKMRHTPLCYGGWIISRVITDQERIKSYNDGGSENFYRCIENILAKYGIWKKGCRVMVKKGEERKTLRVLETIIDRLHKD